MRRRVLVLVSVVGVASLTGGCAGTRRTPRASGSASSAFEDPAPRASATTNAPMSGQGATPPCAPPPCAPPPCEVPCGLPCERGVQQWHVRALGGYSTWFGTDAGEDCGYLGADVGRSLCGSCWSVDAFWRGHTAHFDREGGGEDGGTWNHLGVKASYERSLGGGRWFAWAGAGPEYFWTSDYLHDDSGFGVFGEGGIGYVVNRNLRVRAGVNAHGMNTDVGRTSAADDGDSRWLWIVGPVVGLEIDF